MGVHDIASYILFTNPISTSAFNLAYQATGNVGKLLYTSSAAKENMTPIHLWKLAAATGPYMKLAALSGASAVILGAYGSHRKYGNDEQKVLLDTANRYHFFHTFAIMGLPMCRFPYVAGVFIVSGMLLFSGSCYYMAFTGDKKYSAITPIGGTSLILGWLCMMF